MEKANEFFKNLKDRLSNPLVFSFIISWLVSNWEIVVALVWHDNKQIENEGCRSVFEFISQKLNWLQSFIIPFSVALAYTFLMPVIRVWINALYTKIDKWSEDWKLEILKGGKISIDKYLQLKANLDKRSKILEEVISSESTYINNSNELSTELYTLKNTLNETTSKLNTANTFIKELQDWKIIDGAWQNNYEINDFKKGTESIYIENGKYYIINSIGIKEYKFDIRNFYFDNRNQNIFFVKEVVSEEKTSRKESEHYNINRLHFENKDLLVGTENGTTKIAYRRK